MRRVFLTHCPLSSQVLWLFGFEDINVIVVLRLHCIFLLVFHNNLLWS